MYASRTGLVLGFHGTDESVVKKVVSGEIKLGIKNNPYDWLGHGIYFWDNSYSRALDWAEELSKKKNPSIKKPAVVGAILDLGKCLDLIDYVNLQIIKKAHLDFVEFQKKSGFEIPNNTSHKPGSFDLLNRQLDCAVIESLHKSMQEEKEIGFDSIRGVFWEGQYLYDNAGFKEKNHIQICIRNPNCILGYFLPIA